MAEPIDLAFVSRTGGRPVNEDCADSLQLGDATCVVVADGLGGHRGGEIASKVAVDAVLESFRAMPDATAPNAGAHVRSAQQAVLARQRSDAALSQMRSTVAVLVVGGGRAAWAHVGDTRLYRVRDGRVVERTKDHSVSQSLVDAGEVPPHEQGLHADRSRLRRSLGKEGELGETVHAGGPLVDGDAFLLCTDGFWEVLSDTEIAIDYCASSTAAAWLERLEGRVARRMTPGKDNYTAFAARIGGRTRSDAPEGDDAGPAAGPVGSSSARASGGRGRFALLLLALIVVGSLVVWAAPTIARTLSALRPVRTTGQPVPKAGGEPGPRVRPGSPRGSTAVEDRLSGVPS